MNQLDVKNILNEKLAHMKKMTELMGLQMVYLDNEQIQPFNQKCGAIDNLISDITKIDARISVTAVDLKNDIAKNPDLMAISNEISMLAEENQATLNGMIVRLNKMKSEIKSELDHTVEFGQISGYKPRSIEQPIYIDKLN